MIKLILIVLLMFSTQAYAIENVLKDHPSPYLALHGADPTAWQDWNADVLERAKKEDKLIYISSGYFSCHWCHVMQRESYQNPEIAAILNEHYLPVKIDRELQSALDAHLIDFVTRTQGSAGWPLNVFLTPEGYPIVGFTYQPPDRFKLLLEQVQGIWLKDREKNRDIARRAMLELIVERNKAQPLEQITPAGLQDRLVGNALRYGDMLQGGFGQENKFPMTPQMSVLLSAYERKPDSRLGEFLQLTLNQMATQGLRDQLAGGFFRYTIDPDWHIPHYEKMLYTQARLARLYLDAGRVFGNANYAAVGMDTLDFVLDYMPGRQGAFIASFSAVDEEGVEGGNYLWTPESLAEILTPNEVKVARAFWRMDADPMPEGGYLPLQGDFGSVVSTTKLSEDHVVGLIQSAREKLLKARKLKPLPADNKELASWNGLLLTALVQAGVTEGGEKYAIAARSLSDNLIAQFWDGKQLVRARHDGKALGAAALEDYAYVAEGLILAGQTYNNERYQSVGRELLQQAWQRYYTDDGWSDQDQGLLPGMPRNKAQEDGALPSAAALVIQLSQASTDEVLKAKAVDALQLGFVMITPDPFWYAGYAEALIRQAASSAPATVPAPTPSPQAARDANQS
ncbi:MAG: thioredoxin domain-containing protein [bacterium]